MERPCCSRTRRCPTRWRRPPGRTCSAAPNTRARSRSTRSAPSAGKRGANTVASRSSASNSPGRLRRNRKQPGRPNSPSGAIGGEEVRSAVAGAELRVLRPVADELGGEPALLPVGEAALELLQGVAASDAAAEIEREAELGRVVDEAADHILHRCGAELGIGAAAEVVVKA